MSKNLLIVILCTIIAVVGLSGFFLAEFIEVLKFFLHGIYFLLGQK